jgi:hypothetical protein
VVTKDKTWTMTAIKAANAEAGYHWFEPGTLRFFASRVGDTVYQGPGGVYFVSSEQFKMTGRPDGPRRYTVRRFLPETGAVVTVGPFCESSRVDCVRACKRAAIEGPAFLG